LPYVPTSNAELAIDLQLRAIILSTKGRLLEKSMSRKIALAALLLASVPLAGLADDNSSKDLDAAAEKKSENRSEKPKRDSSDIIQSKSESRADRDERRSQREERREERRRSHKDRERGKGGGKGGRNPSPDD
jgi:hypothetical protein